MEVIKMPLEWGTVSTNSATSAFYPAGPWQSATGITSAKGWGECVGRNGNISVTPAVQLVNDPRAAPAGGTAVGTAMTANGVSDPNGDTAISSGAYKYIRGGWNVVLSAGGTLATAHVGGVIELIKS